MDGRNTMRRFLVAGVMAMMSVCVGTSQGATYDYRDVGTLDLNDGDWIRKTFGTFFDTFYSSTLNEHSLNFTHVFSDATPGSGSDKRGAYVWTAPVGEYITAIQFDYAASVARMPATVFIDTNPAAALNGYDVAWNTTTNAANGLNQLVEFDLEDEIQSVGLGFFLNTGSFQTDQVQFAQVRVTTAPIPEPASLALAFGGGLVMLARSRRHR
jgi:hypothetical protein